MRTSVILALAVLALFPLAAIARPRPTASRTPVQKSAPPQVAPTPPWAGTVGTSSPASVTDQDIRNAADQLVATGMKDAGYVYVNIDDTWEGDRDANGVLHANSKFPDMKALADYVHSKGLKLGIYSSPGPKTCAGYRGLARSRGAGRAALRLLGHRLPEVRSVQLYPGRDG